MSMPKATLCYNADNSPVVARGLGYTEDQLDEAINGPVKDILLDTEGSVELTDLLSGLSTTDFDAERVSELLQTDLDPEYWLVGEALAEAFVADNDSCIFPWPSSRDLKNPDASPAGADLTGFQQVDDEQAPYRFAFGEVKTSGEQNHPPQVVTSPASTGLKNQLEGLKDSDSTRQGLVLYLARHSINASWQHMFKSAAKRYLVSDYTDFAIFGVLVRDVTPDASDLSGLAITLSQHCSGSTSISLYAIYLHTGGISSLYRKSLAAINGGDE